MKNEPAYKYYLVDEIYAHCNFALSGLVNIVEHLESKEQNPQHKGIWADLQIALTHSAIVAAYLFSTKQSANERTKFLQEKLKPSEESPLKNKKARNYLTHIDEKFDYWLNIESSFSGMLEMVFPNRKSFKYSYYNRFFIRRVLLKEELIFIFQNGKKIEEYELSPLFKELEIILENANKVLNEIESDDNGFYIINSNKNSC